MQSKRRKPSARIVRIDRAIGPARVRGELRGLAWYPVWEVVVEPKATIRL